MAVPCVLTLPSPVLGMSSFNTPEPSMTSDPCDSHIPLGAVTPLADTLGNSLDIWW